MHMTMERKLFTSLGRLTTIALLMGGFAIHNVGKLGDGVQELGGHSADMLYLAGDVNRIVGDMHTASRGILLCAFVKQPEKIRAYNPVLTEDMERLKRGTAEMVEHTSSVEIKDIIARAQILDKLDGLQQHGAGLSATGG